MTRYDTRPKPTNTLILPGAKSRLCSNPVPAGNPDLSVDGNQAPLGFRGSVFATTHWSVVLAAAKGESATGAIEALEELCRVYWYPLYAYIRWDGHSPEDAQDLAQGFFARLLEKNYLESVHPDKGKFRSFLLACLNHFMANERDRAQALKRGGETVFVPFETDAAEGKYDLEPQDSLTPAMIFERRWALAVLERALERLRTEFARSGRIEQFERLKVFLEGDGQRGDYREVARELKVSPGAVAMAVHRLRHRYRDLVRAEVANTVGSTEDLEEEMRFLFSTLSR